MEGNLSNEDRETQHTNADIFYCGCLTCRRKNKLWISRPTWFRHKPDREEQIRTGQIPAPDSSHAVPLKRDRGIRHSLDGNLDAPPRKRNTAQVPDRTTLGDSSALPSPIAGPSTGGSSSDNHGELFGVQVRRSDTTSLVLHS